MPHRRALVYSLLENSVGETPGALLEVSKDLTSRAITSSVAYVADRKLITSTYDDNILSGRPDDSDFLEDRRANREDEVGFLMKRGEIHIETLSWTLILSQAPLIFFYKDQYGDRTALLKFRLFWF